MTCIGFNDDSLEIELERGKLRILKRLGKSIMGTSYLGVLSNTEEYFFVKQMAKKNPDFLWTSEEMNKFRNYFMSYVSRAASSLDLNSESKEKRKGAELIS